MMDLRRSLLAISLFTFGCAGSVQTGSSEGQNTADIINGQIDPGHLNVLEMHYAVGTQGYVCTATLIGPSTALTAGHCWPSGLVSPTIATPGGDVDIVRGTPDPAFVGGSTAENAAHDMTVVHLAHPIIGIEPALLARTPPIVGEQITMVGYGQHDTAGDRDDTRRSGTNYISDLDEGYFETDYTNEFAATIAPGDSGGPAFVVRNGRPAIAGVASRSSGVIKKLWGLIDDTEAFHARVDFDLSWLLGEAGADLYDGTHYPEAATGTPVATLSSMNATKDATSAAGKPFNVYVSEAGTGAVEVTIRVDGQVFSDAHVDALPANQIETLTVAAGTHYFDVEVADSATGVVLSDRTWTVTVTP